MEKKSLQKMRSCFCGKIKSGGSVKKSGVPSVVTGVGLGWTKAEVIREMTRKKQGRNNCS